jgi:hypothetical protein
MYEADSFIQQEHTHTILVYSLYHDDMTSRFHLPPSPPRAPPLYTGGYPTLPPLQLHPGQVDYMQMPGVIHDDPQRHFQGIPVEEGLHPPFPHLPIQFNPYHPSDYNNYYPALPLEPFTDYSFAFDPSRPHQGRPPFPLPLRNAPVDNRYHSNNHLAHLNHISDVGPQFPYEYASNPLPPPRYFFPSSPQILFTPPMPQGPSPGNAMRNHIHHRNEVCLCIQNLLSVILSR